MEYYSTKICTKCFSAQEPHSRFCDNCGQAFEETAATDGNISVITKTFLKQQVSQTRPFFWLCIIMVGMLAVFGFAQAGVFRGDAFGSAGSGIEQSASLVSKEQPVQPAKTEGVVPAASDTMLDLNNSVFEMRDSAMATATHVTGNVKRKPRQIATKQTAEPTKTGSTEVLAAPNPVPAEPIASKAPEKDAAKPAGNGSATPKTYLRGPMGGCYYISASGSKRYVDRGLCN